MYIRRKVFSLLQDENGEERYFSTTDYEYQKEFTLNDEERKMLRKIGKIALGTIPGTVSGIRKANKEDKGEDEGFINKYAEVLPFLINTPNSIKHHRDLTDEELLGRTAETIGEIGSNRIAKEIAYNTRKKILKKKKNNKK